MKRRVAVYGVWDLFHHGHINMLKRAKAMGNFLLVGVTSDKWAKHNGKTPYYPLWLRKRIIESLGIADVVVTSKGNKTTIKQMKEYDIDVYVKGNDWKGKINYLNGICEVVYLPRTRGISTTKIKEYIKDEIEWESI